MPHHWYAISAAERNAREASHAERDWRLLLVEVGSEALEELEALGGAKEVRKKLREAVQLARTALR